MSQEIPRIDRPSLALLCGIQESDPVPPEVEVQYWRARRLISRVGAGGPLPPAALVCVGLCAGLGYEIGKDEVVVTFEDRVRSGDIKANDRILVDWRGKKAEVTFLKLTTGRRVQFLFDDKKDPCTVGVQDAFAVEG